jgi:hypothetical protein
MAPGLIVCPANSWEQPDPATNSAQIVQIVGHAERFFIGEVAKVAQEGGFS